MSTKDIAILAKKYKETKNPEYFIQIMDIMKPIVKKYAFKLYSLEYEDCVQELNIAIYEALESLNYIQNDLACTKYITQSIKNKFNKLYHKSIFHKLEQQQQTEYEDFECPAKESPIDDTIFLIDLWNQVKSSEKIKLIAVLLYYGYSDQEIGQKLQVSRQYVNRIKKKIWNDGNS